ncbi:MAG TPA: glycoside-pentoside-hexuronide (GPH):cation symporter [Halothiobacillus sp.]|nr:glycoside-pentoside-hexuronide (GPH):cation symporter [Halothiobacillus sp.]
MTSEVQINETGTNEVPLLTVTEKVGYGFGDLASNMFWQMFSIFIAKYYTDVFLLSAATMGTMLLVTRVIDAFVDPVIGAIADRTKTRWGSFRPYLIWMSIPMAATAIMTFSVPDYGGTARVIYAFVTLTLMMIAYSAINIPYSALLGVLTPNSQDRTSACSYRFVMALLPVFIIVNSAIPLAKYFGGSENSPKGWQMTMIIYSVVAVILYFATFAMTKERVHPEPGQKTSLKGDIKDLLANRPWVVLCVVGIAALTYANIRNTVAIYYFENVVPHGMSYFGPVMTTGALAFIAGVMLTSPLSKKFGKRKFYMVSMGLTTVLTACFYFVPPENIALVWSANTLINFVAAPTAPLVWAMYADTADYSEWKTGRRATGLTFSAASFAQKLGWAIGGAGTGWLLAFFGYQAAVAQSAHTINGIMMMMSVIPAVGSLIAMAALWFYELDEAMVKKMSSELAIMRGKKPAVTGRVTGSQPAGKSVQAPAVPGAPAVLPLEMFMTQAPNAPQGQALRASPSAPPESVWTAGQPFAGGGTRDGGVALSPTPMTPEQLAALSNEYRVLLQSGVHGLCFSPYLEGQSPGSQIGAAQIRARLELIKPYTRWVRSFSCTDGHEQTPRIAHELGLKTLVGAWLGTDREINERELQGVIDVARAGHADIVAVGNEVLLREDLSEEELLACIQRVKDAVPGVRVGYVDAYYLFEKHPRITAACDVILTNCYPFWEGCPREQALAYMQSMVNRTQAVAGGKPVIISETGWPGKGSPFHGAMPSPEGAMRYFIDTMNWAQQDGIGVFYFEAFDEAWKVGAEGDVGAYWGLWDKDGKPKYA